MDEPPTITGYDDGIKGMMRGNKDGAYDIVFKGITVISKGNQYKYKCDMKIRYFDRSFSIMDLNCKQILSN